MPLIPEYECEVEADGKWTVHLLEGERRVLQARGQHRHKHQAGGTYEARLYCENKLNALRDHMRRKAENKVFRMPATVTRHQGLRPRAEHESDREYYGALAVDTPLRADIDGNELIARLVRDPHYSRETYEMLRALPEDVRASYYLPVIVSKYEFTILDDKVPYKITGEVRAAEKIEPTHGPTSFEWDHCIKCQQDYRYCECQPKRTSGASPEVTCQRGYPEDRPCGNCQGCRRMQCPVHGGGDKDYLEGLNYWHVRCTCDLGRHG